MDRTILYTILVMHIVLIGLAVYIAYTVNSRIPIKEGYYLADYYKLRQCRCIPQYDKPTFTDYN